MIINHINNNKSEKSNKSNKSNKSEKTNKSEKKEKTFLQYRNFTVCKVNGKKLSKNVGKYKISFMSKTGVKSKAGPVNAAHKAAVSLVKKNEDVIVENKVKTTITLLELTRGSSRKEYGPYHIIIRNLTSSEYKKKKIRFKKMAKNFGKDPNNFKPKKYEISVKLSE